MIYLRSVLAGIVAVLAVCLVIVVLFVVLPLALMVMRSASTGSGGIGAVSTGLVDTPILLLVPLAFAGGFYWEFRRASKRRSI